jgi:cation diffusion facilitator family transporter
MATTHKGDAHESKRAVLAALAANIGIAVMKFVAFAITGSSSMLSEAIHSVADSGNQGLLLIGRARARRPPDAQHPFGFGPLRYFYAFIVAVVLFLVGGIFSMYEGVDKIRHPHELDGLGWAIAVLLGAMVMEALSFRTGVGEANVVRPGDESWWQFIRRTKNPDLPVVLLEDTAALIGLVFALLGVTLAAVTGNSRWDGVGSLAIGALLVVVAVVLVIEMSSLLVGESARPEVVDRLRATIEAFPTVLRCIHLRTEHLAPDEIVVAAKVEFDHSLSVPELAANIDQLEVELRAAEPNATLIFIEPDVYRDEATEPS